MSRRESQEYILFDEILLAGKSVSERGEDAEIEMEPSRPFLSCKRGRVMASTKPFREVQNQVQFHSRCLDMLCLREGKHSKEGMM